MTLSPAYDPKTMPEYDAIVPPQGSRVWFFFTLTKLGTESPNFPVVSLNYNRDVNTPELQGTLTLPWDKDLYDDIDQWDEFSLFWGWGGDTAPAFTSPIFTGYVKDVKPSNLNLVIDFYDKGVLLEKTDNVSYSNQWRSFIVTDIIQKAGLKPYIDWAETGLDSVISYNSAGASSSTNTTSADTSATTTTDTSLTDPSLTTGADTASYVTGAGTIAASLDKTKKDDHGENLQYGRWYQTTVSADCPFCSQLGKHNTIVWVHGSHQHYCKPGDWTDGGMYKCCVKRKGCDRDWSIMGQNEISVNDDPSRDLKIVSGPKRVNAPIDFSDSGNATDSGAANQTDNSASSGKSYWQMLIDVITPSTNALMIFVWMDTCFVVPVPSADAPASYVDSKGKFETRLVNVRAPSAFNLFVDDRVNVEKGTVTITDPPPGNVNQVIVEYGKTAIPKSVVAQDKNLIDKFGLKSQKYTQYGLNEEEAQAFADNTLKKGLRDNGYSIDLTAVGSPLFLINTWCRTILTRYGIDDMFFITRVNHKIDNKKAPRVDISLNEYYPDVSLTNSDNLQSDIGNLSNTNDATIDQIGQAEAKFRDCQPEVCGPQTSTPAANDKYGYSDCWGDSFWLFNKLKAAGVKVRIVCCNTGEHRWIQIDTGSGWQNWNYKKYNSKHHGPEGCHSGAGDFHVLSGYST